MYTFERLSAAFARELKVYAAIEPILQSILEPALYLLVFAPLMSRVLGNVPYQGGEYGYLAFILPGIVTLTAFVVGVRSGARFVQEYAAGTLESLFALPVRRAELFLAKVGAIVVQVWAEVAVLLVFGVVLAEDLLLTPARLAVTFLFAGLLAATFASLMIFGATRLEQPRRFAALATVVVMPLMLLSSAFYPVVGSDLLATVMTANPITQCARLMRTALLLPDPNPAAVAPAGAYLAVLCVASLAAGAYGYASVLDE